MNQVTSSVPNRAAPFGGLLRRAWARPAAVAFGLTLLLFGSYLSVSHYKELYYDANGYWDLATQYWGTGQFRFLSYDNLLRGYLFPLLLAPLTRLAEHFALEPIVLTRAVGALTAAALFGVVVPGLWRAVRAPGAGPVPLGRRLLLALLGFVCWRGYFNFPLTDFPALLALTAGLWAVLRGRGLSSALGSGLLAGVLVAAAANFRPIYAATLLVAALLCVWPLRHGWRQGPREAWGPRLAAFAVGVALVLAPQARLNQFHVGVASPLVLTTRPGTPSLYLQQLHWGLQMQRYETNVGRDYPEPAMRFLDAKGQALLARAGLTDSLPLASYGQYGQLMRRAPLTVAGVWLGHLFNGLDLHYPTPYIPAVYVPTWPLAWLNYTVLLGGLLVLGGRARRLWRGGWPAAGPAAAALLVAAALLGSCLPVLPVAIECRFLLPLHLLLSAAFVFGLRPQALWRRWRAASLARRLALGGLYVVLMLACFRLALKTQFTLQHGARDLTGTPTYPLGVW